MIIHLILKKLTSLSGLMNKKKCYVKDSQAACGFCGVKDALGLL